MAGVEHTVFSMYILEFRITLFSDSLRLQVRKRPILCRMSHAKRVTMPLLTSSPPCSRMVSTLMEMFFVVTCLHGEFMFTVFPRASIPLLTFRPNLGPTFAYLEGKEIIHRYVTGSSTLCARSVSQEESCNTLKSRASAKIRI